MKTFKCQCLLGEVEIQEYQNSPAIKPHKNINSKKDLISIDFCLIPEIWRLWRMGIVTTGCCCGHNKGGLSYIGVEERFIPTMKELGYEVAPNFGDKTREDSFYPKSLTLCEKPKR